MRITGPPLDAPLDLAEILKQGLATKPDSEALVSRRRRWTWRMLESASTRLAGNYLDLGLSPGDRIASLMPNRTELMVHYFACMKCGLVAVPLNYRYMAPEIDHALAVSGAKILLAHDERREDLAGSKLAGKLPLGQISYGENGGRGDPSFKSLTEGEPTRGFAPPKMEDPAIIFFTSGSTGKPKGVGHSFATLGWIVASAAKSWEMAPDDIMMPGGSASHVGGHHLSMMTFATGGKVVMPRTFDGDEILPLLREERPTKLWMLPSALYALTRDHGAGRADFSSVKACYSGGDKVSEALEKEFTALAGIAIDEDYGMTEIGIPTVNPPAAAKIGSVGLLGPGYQASLRDDDGREVATGVDGRLWIKFPGNMVGYWNDPKATAETIVDGWLDTGDVMSADEDGYLWFHGRKKQIIVHDGSNICPQEVEAALLEHDAVASAGVVGVQSAMHGENVRAYVTLEPGAAPLTMQALIQFTRARVGYKAPEEVIVLDRMPLNATGKIDRVTLKRLAEKGLEAASAQS
ncbi:acyl-CoA synthetase [Mesorhizobium sp. L-8-10]|uniref:class I adenylate-forming enzyme family protein n=1 Tax=Mesorhizobium sp. L-8-10 TaxID=2744523 RepID=UPI001928F735|nr:class I adenylate-forming enzyme family protein [Mesorhizobium sp. L-8-10]BCH31187.1 acyl-CoA synthetase [Mesorhizobium sp. L-8-10]